MCSTPAAPIQQHVAKAISTESNEQDEEENIQPKKLSKNMSPDKREGAVCSLIQNEKEFGKLKRGVIGSCSKEFNCSPKTVKRIWERYLETVSQNVQQAMYQLQEPPVEGRGSHCLILIVSRTSHTNRDQL